MSTPASTDFSVFEGKVVFAPQKGGPHPRPGTTSGTTDGRRRWRGHRRRGRCARPTRPRGRPYWLPSPKPSVTGTSAACGGCWPASPNRSPSPTYTPCAMRSTLAEADGQAPRSRHVTGRRYHRGTTTSAALSVSRRARRRHRPGSVPGPARREPALPQAVRLPAVGHHGRGVHAAEGPRPRIVRAIRIGGRGVDPAHRQGVDRLLSHPLDARVQRLDQFQHHHDAHGPTVRGRARPCTRVRERRAADHAGHPVLRASAGARARGTSGQGGRSRAHRRSATAGQWVRPTRGRGSRPRPRGCQAVMASRSPLAVMVILRGRAFSLIGTRTLSTPWS
ncbi:hypothetical protein ABH930_004452 [Kitasatospora sp. GAS204A]|nr:hypothetical protein [Kitasatospora sp. GAS204B]